jgi:hypothetical protein
MRWRSPLAASIAIILVGVVAVAAFAATSRRDASGNGVYDKAQGAGTQTNPFTPVTAPAPYVETALGCAQLASLGTAAGFASVPAGATLVRFSVTGQSVRYRDDGTNPTATVGVVLPTGVLFDYSGALGAIKFIQTASSAVLDACFYQ